MTLTLMMKNKLLWTILKVSKLNLQDSLGLTMGTAFGLA